MESRTEFHGDSENHGLVACMSLFDSPEKIEFSVWGVQNPESGIGNSGIRNREFTLKHAILKTPPPFISITEVATTIAATIAVTIATHPCSPNVSIAHACWQVINYLIHQLHLQIISLSLELAPFHRSQLSSCAL